MNTTKRLLILSCLASLPALAHGQLVAKADLSIKDAAPVAKPLRVSDAWSKVDGWERTQVERARQSLVSEQNRFIPQHLRDQNGLRHLAEREALLVPQRRVGRGLDAAPLYAGAFTLAKPSELSFAGADDSPESALGVVVEYGGDLAFAGHLPAKHDEGVTKQARGLSELVGSVAPGAPVRITLITLDPRQTAQLAEVRCTLGELYAGVPVTVTSEWP